MTALLRQAWARRIAVSAIRHGQSPLDYHGQSAERLSIHDSNLDGPANSYFKPPHSALPEDDDTVAFLDYSEYADHVYIRFMATRPSHARQGLARQLVEHLYAMTDKDIDWGRIISDEAVALWRDIAQKHPTRWNKGKVW